MNRERRSGFSRGAGLAVAALLFALGAARAVAQPPTGQARAEAAGHDLLGAPAPTLVVTTIDGESIDLGAFRGKQAVYLKFWATWCVPCMRQMPHFEDAYETAGADLAVLGVNTGFNDSLAAVRTTIAEKGLKMPTVIDDGRLAAAFNLRVTPQHVVIGRDGRVDYVGFLADERLDAALRAAQAPPVPTSGDGPASKRSSTAERRSLGDGLPDLSAVTLDGRTFHARDADRRPTALVFLSPWCESYFAQSRPAVSAECRQVREQVAALASREDGVRWLGVASRLWTTPDELRTYDAELSPRIPLMLDESGEWFRAFDVMHTPTIVIADGDGTIVERVRGFDSRLSDAIARVRGR
jgi:peroxiredoxin